MKFKKSIILWGLMFTVQISAQEIPNIAPPSPEASSVFKFAEIPVSLYTGTPNITIPLMSIEARGITIPITLSYHARGIKVDEIASRVGLGWSLNCGGMISRQVRGLPDEAAHGYLESNTNSYGFFNYYSDRLPILNANSGGNPPKPDYLPDQFFFSAGNLSGKFVLDSRDNGKAVIQQFSDVKIDYSPVSSVITDGTGNKYYYGGAAVDYDSTIQSIVVPTTDDPQLTNVNDDDYPNTWHLNKIVTAQGEVISFSYKPEDIESSVIYRRSCDVFENHMSNTVDSELGFSQYKTYCSKVTSYQSRLSEITFDKGKVVFSYIDSREDLNGKTLNHVTLYDTNSNKIKEFELKYFYTTAQNNANLPNYDGNQLDFLRLSEPKAAKRLFLKSVQALPVAGNDSIPPYRFEYNEIKLPNRHSNSQDAWGYYNGQQNGKRLKLSYDHNELGNRNVDTINSGAGMLQKIINPEGGSTSFTYEHNRGLNIMPSSVIFPATNPIKFVSTGLGSLENSFYDPVATNFSKVLQIGKVVGRVRFDVNLYNDIGCTTDNNTNGGCAYKVTLSKPGQPVITLYKGFNYLDLAPGTYTLKVKATFPNYDHTNQTMGFNIPVLWKESIASEDALLYGAGKRIRKIEYRDADNTLGLSKTYSYSIPATGMTSGKIFGIANFLSLARSFGSISVYDGHGSTPGGPTSTYQGNSVGYELVTEYVGEGATVLGKTEHRFSMIPDTGEYYHYPQHPPTDNEWLRGKELSVSYFKKTGNIFSPVKKIESSYLFSDYLDNEGKSTEAIFNPIPIRIPILDNMTLPALSYIKDKRMFRLPLSIVYAKIIQDSNGAPVISNIHEYKTFHLTGGTADLLFTKTTDYFDGSGELFTQTNYSYNYDKHYNTASVENTGSDGSTNTTKYFYAGDDPIVHSALHDKNMVSMPLLTQNFKGTELLSQQETTYKNWDNVMLAPEFMKSSKGDKPLETRVEYVKVDPLNGNPLEVKQSGGMSICYIWGYNKTKPIAKIENVTYATVEPYVSNLQTKSNGQDETALIGALNSLRTALPNAMVTTFTYKPLIGVSTITNPSGQKTTYDYDHFGRLKSVKDHNGHLLSENKYHYAAPTN